MTLDTTFLGIIAISTLAMAAIQIGLAVYAAKTAAKAAKAADELRREIAPIIAKVHKVTDDAGRVTALALTQVERIDEFIGSTSTKVAHTLTAVHDLVNGPVRQGSALWTGLSAALSFFADRQKKSARHGQGEEDESLFIG